MPFIVTRETHNGDIEGIYGVYYMVEAALKTACDSARFDLPDDLAQWMVAEIEMDSNAAPVKKFRVQWNNDRPVIDKWEGKR